MEIVFLMTDMYVFFLKTNDMHRINTGYYSVGAKRQK
jgi:hypothetical protein